ncbi:hypothetical protein V8E36_003269 [Tilletia maclaganii]
MRAESTYIAVSANRASFVADSGLIQGSSTSGFRPFVAYASHKSVALWLQPLASAHSGAEQLIPTAFQSEITLLQAAHRSTRSTAEQSVAFLLAGSRTGELVILRPLSHAVWTQIGWPSATSKAHSATVTTAHVLEGDSLRGTFLAVTGSADGQLHIWRIHAPTSSDAADATWSVDLLQTIFTELEGALPLCAQLVAVPSVSADDSAAYLLALAVTKSYIQLWMHDPTPPAQSSSSSSQPYFSLALQLSGHEDWVRTLAFAHVSQSELILASGGQDNYVRLWRIARHTEAPHEETTAKNKSEDDDYIEKLMRKIELGDDDSHEGGAPSSGERPSNRISASVAAHGRAFAIGAGAERSFWVVTMDALLVGHDSWVTSLRWHPIVGQANGSRIQPAALLSTSADNSVIVWAPAATSPEIYVDLSSESAATSIWAPQQRFGELGSGSSLGFYGGLWTSPSSIDPDQIQAEKGSKSPFGIFCHAFNGATRLWAPSTGTSARRWSPKSAITGHLGPCKSLSWDPSGCMLLSCGSDRTTRLHARYRKEDGQGHHTWHELARPQTHGYNLNDISWIDQWSFASAAEEKVVRVFTAPASFIQTIRAVGGLDGALGDTTLPETAPVGASVPPLGLSNRAIYDESAPIVDGPSESGQPVGSATTSVAGVYTSPPNEDELHVSTLWPELDKLYGHGYELFSIGATQSGQSKGAPQNSFVASACKANTAEHAVIRIHDREQSWREVAQLPGHKLSITRIRFHPGGQGLQPNRLVLSSGRDRSWHLHQLCGADSTASSPIGGDWRTVASQQTHARIVWDCAWSQDGSMFATASRDKTVKVWSLLISAPDSEVSVEPLASVKLDASCTSIAFGPDNLAVGTERGDIVVLRPEDQTRRTWLSVLRVADAHSEAIQELAFRPRHGSDGLFIASAGDDGAVRIHELIDEQ